MSNFSHTDESGKARMVDVGDKPVQKRSATARGFIHLGTETLALITENQIKKGDVLTVAEIAGIQAAKQTSALIPLCHPLPITKVEVKAQPISPGEGQSATSKGQPAAGMGQSATSKGQPASGLDQSASGVGQTEETCGVLVTSTVKCNGQTGVEMEALTAVSMALLTIYDMCKAVDKEMVIDGIRLIKKTKE
jgi:cyclic pyranopterin monophosphate synthase